MTGKFFFGVLSGIILGVIAIFGTSFFYYINGDLAPTLRSVQADHADTDPHQQMDLEAKIDNEKVAVSPQTFEQTVDSTALKEEIASVDLDDVIVADTEIPPRDESPLEEIKQNDYSKEAVENTPESAVEIEQKQIQTPDAETAPFIAEVQKDEKSEPGIKTYVPIQDIEITNKTEAATANNNTRSDPDLNQQDYPSNQNDAAEILIEKLAQDLNEPSKNEETETEDKGESKELTLKTEVFEEAMIEKEAFEEKAYKDTPTTASGPAIEIFAVPPLLAEFQQFMAVVIIDNGNMPLEPEVLSSLPFPVTIAVPGQTEAHRALMQTYRDEGFEVALILDLPDDPGVQEAIETLQGALTIVSEATSILERKSGVLQNDRRVSSAVVDLLVSSGHGLLVYDTDVNPALEMAKSLGVPAKKIYRNLDQDNGNERAMRRFLDGAVRRAQQEGSVIIVASLSPSVISALTFWNLQERSSSVIITTLSQAIQAVVP